jgi:K+-sensing histidine kinase KdpD
MESTLERKPRLPALATQSLLGIAGLAFITFISFKAGFGSAKVVFAYLVLLALVSLVGSLSASIFLSILAAACLDFFFIPPLFDLAVFTSDDIVRLSAFLATQAAVMIDFPVQFACSRTDPRTGR